MDGLLWFIILMISIYTIIPTLCIRIFGLGAYRKHSSSQGIALTFDDGPDPQYTPQLLDLLKRYQVKATFFVLGSKAKKYPELIARMQQEGHLVGIHNFVHWANALMSPWKVRLQLSHSVAVIEAITGEKPVYYRPPWGIINLFDFFLLKRFRLVFWSIIVGDWRSSVGKRKIKQRLLSRLRDGAVIVLHDSGQTFGANQDAPVYMLEALHDFIQQAIVNGYSFVRIDEKMKLDKRFNPVHLRLSKRFLVFLWLQWESLFHFFFELKPVDHENQLLYYRVCTYHGQTIVLSDEESINNGDPIIEFHFNNKMLLHMTADTKSMVQLAVLMIRSVKNLLPKMTEKMIINPDYGGIKGVYGITMIHRGTSQLGFTLVDLPKGFFAIITRFYLRILLYILHPDGKQRLQTKSDFLTPKMIFMSTKELFRRYPVDQVTQENIQVNFPSRVNGDIVLQRSGPPI
jgi:peptidoglycan/xylan/chitin deacetylase (PgdA/CDA1 family)